MLVKPEASTEIIMHQEEKEEKEEEVAFNTIKWLHFSACIFFLVQTVIYSAIHVEAMVNPTIGKREETCQGPICPTVLKYLGDANCIFIIPLFVALAFFDHLLSFLCCQFSEPVARFWLFKVGSNPLRWMEYSISASFMTIGISILCGVSDVHLWFLMFIMTGIGMFCGQIVELIPKEEHPDIYPVKFTIIRSLAFWLGSISIFSPWLVMGCYFFSSVDSSTPEFVYAAFLVTFVLFLTFGLNSYLHNILGKYKFYTAEIVYISLSFTAKTFLAADVFGGLNAA
jgi:hypothetical protein